MERDDETNEARARRIRWLWRGVAAVWAAAAVGASLYLRGESLGPGVLARDEDALRRACLGFPLPVMLYASRVHRFRDSDTGTQTLSYRLPGDRPADRIYAYYDEYLRRSGFSPAVQGIAEALRRPAAPAIQASPADGARVTVEETRRYIHADRLRTASVSVRTEPLRGDYRMVIVTVRPV